MNDEINCPDCLATFFGPNRGRELGGHAKTHRRHREDVPACFLDRGDWESALSRLRTEHPTKAVISPTFALAESCAVCPLEFMQEMQSKGRCHPPAGAIPQRDLGIDFEEAM